MAKEYVVKIVVDNEEAKAEIQEVNDALEQTGDSAKEAGSKMSTAIKGVGTALKAAGIGLVLAALSAIVDIFRSSPAGARIITQALETVNQAMLALWNNAGRFAQIMQNIFSGQFGAAAVSAQQFWEIVVEDSIEAGSRIADLDQAVKALNRSLVLVFADQRAIMEQQRVVADTMENSQKRRLQAMLNIEQAARTLRDAQRTTYNTEIELLKERGLVSEADQDRYYELLAMRREADEEYSARLNENITRREQIQQENIDNMVEHTRIGLDDQLEAEIDYTAAVISEEDKRAAAVVNAEGEKQEARQATADQALSAASGMFAGLADLMEEGSRAQEGFNIASVVMDAAAAIIATWKGYAGLGPWGTAAAIAQTVTIAATALKSIQQIKSKDEGAFGNVNAGASGVVGSPMFNVVQAQPNQTLAEQLAGVTAEPVKAYVVGSEVTSQQALDRQIVNQASF